MEEKTLDLDKGLKIKVTVKTHANARRVKLTIDHRSGAARVAVPKGLSLEQGWKFAQKNKGWLQVKVTALQTHPSLQPGQVIPYQDGQLSLLASPQSNRVILDQDCLHVGGRPEFFARRVADYFKDYTRKDLTPRVLAKSKALGFPAKRIAIRDQKTRWGSCSSSGTLSFSWRISLAPEFVRDYLVAHEVAHLKEMNHGPNFWSTCDTLCAQGRPQRDAAEDWLRLKGGALMAIRADEPE